MRESDVDWVLAALPDGWRAIDDDAEAASDHVTLHAPREAALISLVDAWAQTCAERDYSWQDGDFG